MKTALLISLLFSVLNLSCTKKESESSGTPATTNDVDKVKLEGNSASELLFKLQADKRTKTIQSNNSMTHVRLGPIECLRVGSHGGKDLAITTTCLITP